MGIALQVQLEFPFVLGFHQGREQIRGFEPAPLEILQQVTLEPIDQLLINHT